MPRPVPSAAPGIPGRPPRWQRRLRRHRRWAAAALAGLLAWTAVSALHPPAAALREVVVARGGLAPGARLAPDDLALEPRPVDTLPADPITDLAAAAGRLVAAPLHPGEPLRERDIVGPALLAAFGRGYVAVPVRLADEGVTALLRPGDVVDVVAADEDAAGTTSARIVAAGVRVLVVPQSTPGSVLAAPASAGPLVVVAAPPASALELARAQASGRVGVVWRSG